MATCLISIGSNQGNRTQIIASALADLRANPAILLCQSSGYHVTQPIGGPAGQGEFVNAAAVLETSLPPHELLSVLQSLESQAGRTRDIRWQARPLDLDLLLYDDLVLNDRQLVLPHPRMAFRRFVLAPANEIVPEMMHPLLGRSIRQLLEHLDQALNYVAITGIPAVGKSRLAQAVAARVGASAVLDVSSAGDLIDDAAGPALATELEFVQRRGEQLRDARHAAEDNCAISDFWLEQSLAYSRTLCPHEYPRVEAACREASEHAIPPKLIVFVAARFEDLRVGAQADRLVAVQTHLREHCQRTGQPPTLTLEAAHASWNEQEVAAAILAMK